MTGRAANPQWTPCGEGGAASVTVLSVGLVVLLLGGALAVAGTATVARHRAQAAADFGALSAALHAIEGEEAACAAAARTVEANGARLTTCELTGVGGLDALVTAEAVPTGPTASFGTASARARAGPQRDAAATT